MRPALSPDIAAGAASQSRGCWQDLLALGLLALLVRTVFFNGPFGSDDVVYLQRAIAVAHGDWSSSNYNGALRYAFNIPAGFFVHLFGVNTTAANLWPLLCSLAEVLLVYRVAADIWGRRAGLCAGLILATVPLHVSVASRVHVDPVVSLFLSLGFALLYFGSQRRSRWLWFASGLSLGAVYWAKELAAVTLFAFLVFPLVWRRMPPGWLHVVAGGAVMLAAHLALMAVIAADPLHLFKVVLAHPFIADGTGDGSATYYFRFLLLDLRHTGPMSWLALAAVVLVARDRQVRWTGLDGRSFVVLWLVSVLAVLSFFPVSLSPLRFSMKQSNYLTLFLAPMAILAGYAVSRLPRRLGGVALCVAMAGGLLLAGLQQADYRAFASNSKAAFAFAQAHPGHAVVGSRSTSALGDYYAQVQPHPGSAPTIRSLTEAAAPAQAAQIAAAPAPVYVVWDPLTQQWAGGGGGLQAPLACWQRVQDLTPAGLAWTNHALAALAAGLAHSALPRVPDLLVRLGTPARATVYAAQPADLWCGRSRSQERTTPAPPRGTARPAAASAAPPPAGAEP